MNCVDYDICETQGRIYEYAASEGYNMPLFSSLYLQSSFCKRAFDTIYSRFQVADELECMDFILPEIGNKLIKDGTFFNEDVAFWIGFTYRQLYIETKIGSAELCTRIPFTDLCNCYPGLHTIDEEMAAEILIRNYDLKREQKK